MGLPWVSSRVPLKSLASLLTLSSGSSASPPSSQGSLTHPHPPASEEAGPAVQTPGIVAWLVGPS